MLPIGVLALQGDVREHISILRALNIPFLEVRKPEQLELISGLIIPGGESTVIDKLSRIFGVAEPLKRAIQNGLPVFGTCAGLILLANKLLGATKDQQTFGGLDVTVQRNAFGSQLDSFEAELEFDGVTGVKAAFIRAPLVAELGPGVKVLSQLNKQQIVAVRQGNLLGISFHPEVCGETTVHAYFLEMCKTANYSNSN